MESKDPYPPASPYMDQKLPQHIELTKHTEG